MVAGGEVHSIQEATFGRLYEQTKKLSIIPVYKPINSAIEPIEFFSKLSDYGRSQNSIFLESAATGRYGEQSFGSANPCLKLIGKGNDFEITGLNMLGFRFIELMEGDFDFCDEAEYNKGRIKGSLAPERKAVSEHERLKLKTHIDIIRKIAFKFNPTVKPVVPYAGLFGAISYDFVDQFEELPKNKKDLTKDADYELNFYDNLFLVDHKKRNGLFIANAITGGDCREEYERCNRLIEGYEKTLQKASPKPRIFPHKKQKSKSDTTKEEFGEGVKKIKEHILKGDIFQAVFSRTIVSECSAEPLDIYSQLRKLNPSPYMFYLNNKNGILLGSSPEMYLRVMEGKLTLRPIAGTKPRGITNGSLDKELDSRYETQLKIDRKELAEHAMLVDLARNDIARVSKPGTRVVDEPLIVEKYSHVQHLVSNVSGILKEGLDPLHAYLACMNMGTLTGAPKVEAMKLIRKYEKTKRGLYGGAVVYLTPSRDIDSAIIIRSMQIKKGRVFVRAGAGIVHDSVPEREYDETEAKAAACLKAVVMANNGEKNERK